MQHVKLCGDGYGGLGEWIARSVVDATKLGEEVANGWSTKGMFIMTPRQTIGGPSQEKDSVASKSEGWSGGAHGLATFHRTMFFYAGGARPLKPNLSCPTPPTGQIVQLQRCTSARTLATYAAILRGCWPYGIVDGDDDEHLEAAWLDE